MTTNQSFIETIVYADFENKEGLRLVGKGKARDFQKRDDDE